MFLVSDKTCIYNYKSYDAVLDAFMSHTDIKPNDVLYLTKVKHNKVSLFGSKETIDIGLVSRRYTYEGNRLKKYAF